MHIFKRIFLFIALTAVFFWNVGCTLNPGEADDNDNTPPVISNPSDDDDKPVVTDPQDNVTFVNKTDLMVKIFSDSLKTNLLTTINYGEKFSCKADVNATGNVFYYTYYLALDKVLIPYGTGQSIVNLSTDKSTTVNIVDPTEINTNKNIVILKNLSSSAISLGYSTSELLAENMTSTLLNQDEYGIYLLEFSNNLADYKVSDAGKNISLSETPTEDKGYIYYFDYTGKEVVLNSKTFFNKDLKNKIWKISLSQETGKTLLAGHFTTRKKSENGYMLLGRIAYNSADSSLDDTVPYYTFISPNGEILEEQTPFFRDEPRNVKIRGCVDTGKYILASGEKLSSDGIPYGFVMGIEGVNVYKDIYFADETGDENDYFSAEKIIQKTDNTFCVFVWKDKHSAPGYTEDNYISTGIGLVEVTVDSFTSVSTRILWESDEESNFNGAYSDFVYDEASDTYVVLTWNNIKDSTEVLFIDGTSGTEKNESVVLENYDFEKITKNIDGNIFLCGAFINQLTYNREACVIEIDISNGSLVDSIPKTFPAKDRNLSSYFNDIVFEDEYVIYAGSTDYKNGGDLDDTIPYMVAYDAVKDKVLWERKFDDLVGYRIYSCSDSDVSFVYELYNEKTCHSYIVSAGIMGEIPEDVKLTLPQSSSIKEVEAPDVTVYLYENFDATDDYAEATFKFGDEITLEDLAKYVPADIPTGYTITGWNKWGADTEDEAITFPYTIEDSPLRFYPKLEQGKTDINCDANELAETITNLSAGEYKIIVSGTMTSDILAAVKTAMKDNESAKINLDLSGTTGLTCIDEYAFEDCNNLTGITIPFGVTDINYYAFAWCGNLTNVTIPDSVTSIGDSSFWGCRNLKSINIPKSVTKVSYYAFIYCNSLTNFDVDTNHNNFSTSDDGKSLYNKDKTELIAYPGATGNITILDGVTSIHGGIFNYNSDLTSVVIPDSVTSIDNNSFQRCANLTSVTIPDSVTEIESSAFGECKNLTTINITKNNENYSTSEDGKILYNKDKTYLITYPSATGDIAISEGVTFIADNAFAYCDNLTSVTIPESVFYVDGYAFLDCDNLASVTFEDTKNWYYTSTYGGTKEIDVTDSAQNATDFKSGKYNDKYLIKTANVYSYKLNIEDISGAWGGTTKSPMFSIIFMTDEQVEASKNYGDFNFSSQAYQIFSYANIKIADTNQTGNYAVYGSLPVDDEYQYYTGVAATVTDTTFELILDVSKLKKTEIKWFNSENASGEMLTDSDTLDLSDYKPYVIALGTENADSDNYAMTVWGADVMTMTPSTTSFPTDLEYAAPKVPTCYDLTHIAGNATIDETGEWKHISLDDNSYEFTYTYYGTDEYGDVYDAFKFTNGSWEFQVGGANITALNTEFKLEESQNVGNITFDDGLLTVGRKYTISLIVKDIHEAYVKVDITPTTVYVSDIVNTISTLPAGEHTLAVSGTMDASILSNIASAMKKNTSAMIALDFSNTTGLTAIKNDTFLDCSNITSIVIPNGVTSIGNVAFTNCKSLASVTIPESVTSIAQGQFRLCPNLTCFNVSENNENFSTSDDGKILYSKGKTILIAYPSATGDITIPDGVIEMTWGAFYNCTNITSVTIPDSMIYICDWVFYNCDGLTNIIIPDSVTLIGDSAFSGCSNLKNVTIGEGVTLISYRAFYNCTNLTSVTFKDTSTWYYTDTERSQGGRVLSREEGTQIGVTNPTRNATNLKSTYCEYWWYKR